MAGNDIRFRTSVQNDAKRELAGLEKQLDSVGLKSGGAMGALGKLGVATGGLITPTSIAAAGVFAFAGGIVHASMAAADEETNIAKLNTSLKANVLGWQGVTTGVERQIKANENLAFSDDELRDSLGSIVAVTKNVNEAFKVQKVAMDLARFKHISLADATDGLIKVEAGSYRILKSLGIQLKTNATQTEALAAVEKIAAGQSDAYAKSTLGKIEVLKIKLHDLEEDVGGKLLPAEVGILDFIKSGTDGWAMFADAAHHALGVQTQGEADAIVESAALEKQLNAVSDAGHHAAAGQNHLTESLASGIPTYDKVGSRFSAMTDEMRASMALARSDIKSEVADIVAYTKDRLTNKEIKDILTGKSSLGKQLARGLQDARPDVRDKWEAIQKELLATIDARIKVTITPGGGGKPSGKAIPRAVGGPVEEGQTYLVGEHGPETLVMGNQSGTVIPNGGVNVIQLFVDGKKMAEVVDRHLARTYNRSPASSASF